MPPIPAGCRRIVDIGCGMGQTLMASSPPGAFACGIEPDVEAIRFGRRINREIHLVGGKAEHLPVRSGWAEFAIARLSLPYARIPEAVREVYRVLEPGGVFWSVLHPFSMTLRELLASAASLRIRSTVYQLYVLANGLALHVAGRQLRYPLNRRRCESFQTEGGMVRVLRAAGFRDISASRSPWLVVTAKKPVQPAG